MKQSEIVIKPRSTTRPKEKPDNRRNDVLEASTLSWRFIARRSHTPNLSVEHSKS